MNLPKKTQDGKMVLEKLKEYSSEDMDPHNGRMFSHMYGTDLEELKTLAKKAYYMYMDKTMLNFTVYPSILRIENEIISMTRSLLNGDENVVGNFTYGGTESIFLAVKAARDYHRNKVNTSDIPEIILPATAHPAFYKSAHYLGLKVVRAPIDPSTLKADIEKIKEAITDRTSMIVGSAPNYPYGVIDDIEALGEIASEKKLWLHVDACIGGYVLPFFRKLGEPIPRFDFEVEGVISLSTDLHKYGYTPKGASVILYRDKEYRLHQLYVNASWPGYPLVNTTVLSTRSAGTLAAAWVVLNYLGEEGYLKLAEMILNAKRKLMDGLHNLGYEILGKPQSSIVTFTSDEVNIFILADYMRSKGWYIQVQPGSRYLNFPPSIHLTISPIHCKLIDIFLKDLEESMEEVKKIPEPPVKEVITQLKIGERSPEQLAEEMPLILDVLGLSRGIDKEMALINMLLYEIQPDIVEYLFRLIVNELFI